VSDDLRNDPAPAPAPANVIQLRDATRPPKLRRARSYKCSHPCKVVDLSMRTVECEACGAVLDPYVVLEEIANSTDYTEAEAFRNLLEKQCDDLRGELCQLRESVRKTST
jgi:uncharacterized Zn finger protein